MKKIIRIAFLLLLSLIPAAIVNAEAIGVIGDEVKAYSGSGSVSDPLHYLFDSNSKVSWKHLCDVRDSGITEVYEKREGNSDKGRLLYSWTFSADNITTPEGPYFLGINFYNGDVADALPGGSTAFYFSFACKRDLPGPAVISMDVADKFKDDTKLNLYYYGGYNSAVIHGSTPVIDSNEILQTDELKNIASGIVVKNGCVSFTIRYGGNYFLGDNLKEQKASDDKNDGATKETAKPTTSAALTHKASENNKTAAKKVEASLTQQSEHKAGGSTRAKPTPAKQSEISGGILSDEIADNKSEGVYQEETSLGRIDRLFPTKTIAKAIAGCLSKRLTDEITQADLNGIKRLYLSGQRLESVDELSGIRFERLESLELADNNLTKIPVLQMPMLSYLDLSNNLISDTSPLSEFVNLEVVRLQDNDLKNLPDISTLPKLISIDAGNNEIANIPELKSTSLVYLNLGENHLTKFPGLQDIPNLEYLDIADNRLKKLPDFSVCHKLTEIYSKQDRKSGSKFVILVITIGLGIGLIGAGIHFLRYHNRSSVS